MDHKPPPRRMVGYVWFRIPGKLPQLPAPFFLGHGLALKPGYRTDRVRQDPLPGKLVLSIALSQGGQGCVGGRVQNLKPGHAVFHAPHDGNNWFGVHPQHRGQFEYVGFMFDGQHALDMAQTIRNRYAGPYPLDPQATVVRRLVALTRERSHQVTMSVAEGMSLVCDTLSSVLEAADNELNAPLTRQLAETAEALLNEDPAVDWTVGMLAERCGVSREHLTRAFTQKYGVSPKRYLSELRIQKACSRLRGSDVPIKNIMLDLGFTSHATFTRAFRRYTNMTPSEYRESRPQ